MEKDTVKYYLLLVLIFPFLTLHSQVTVIVDQIPPNTPEDAPIYITGSFNNWDPADPMFRLNPTSDGRLYTQFDSRIEHVTKFKFTRGSWATVEMEATGQPLITRKYSRTFSETDTLYVQINNWADLIPQPPSIEEITIIITQVPKNTPPEAPIYIAGDFNGWTPGDRRHKLLLQPDGTYTIRLPVRSKKIMYKFTRGNWATVEGKRFGRPIPNREFQLDDDSENKVLEVRIKSWEDLSATPINPYTFLLLMAAIQGILLILVIASFQNNNLRANRILILLILLISIALVGRVAIYDRETFNYYPRLMLIPDIIYFLYAPLFLIYIKRLLILHPARNSVATWFYLLPFLIQIAVYWSLLWESKHDFIDRVVDLDYEPPIFVVIGGIALVYNIFFWYQSRSILLHYQKTEKDTYSFEQNIRYLSSILHIKFFCLVIWLLTYIVGGISYLTQQEWSWITTMMIDGIWVIFSSTVYCLGYFAIKQPEVFKFPEVKAEVAPSPAFADQDKLFALKERLQELMINEEPYKNARLTLPELAELSGTSVHELSKAINEGFQKNFYDFVNSYRIKKFIHLAQQDAYQNQTFFAIALEVGFNSKTAFNRAFKKLKQMTPREYLKGQPMGR